MKHVHRTAIGAGFGILVVAGVASSGAFACTREAKLAFADGTAQTMAKPSQMATVKSTSFSRPGEGGYGPIHFEWMAFDETVLARLGTISGPSPALPDGVAGHSFVTEGTTNTATLTFAVPSSARTLPTGHNYWVRASQMSPLRDIPFAGTVQVFISLGYEGTAATAGGAGGATGSTAVSPTGSTQTATVGAESAAATSSVVAAPGRQVAAPAADSTPAAPQVATATAAGVPGTPTVSPVASVDPAPQAVPEPKELQLWSGLKSSASPTSLLDGAPSTPATSSTPAGVILLSMGVLALAGTGAALGQRRLAVAKARR
jgi:hypothetical protein